jgi:hypothetical protein
MTEAAAQPPPLAIPDIEEIEYSLYGFHTEEWEEIPYPTGLDGFSDAERRRRNENADKYRKYGGTPTAWYRYLQLGYFAFEDCSELFG